MEARSLKYLAKHGGGELLQGDPESRFDRLCTDSRLVQPGDLYVALRGERFDGHTFLPEVVNRKAGAVLVERDKSAGLPPSMGLIAVENTRQALGRLAAGYRKDFHLPVVAVGGSNGKTTTKELAASVLRQRYPTLSSEASFNNDIGVPLTLLRLERAHAAAVLEAGTNHIGELAPLIRAIKPKLGILTSIGREHLDHFGSLDAVIEEEGWLAELLPARGTLFVSGDDPVFDQIVRRTRSRVVRVGFKPNNDWRAELVQMDFTSTQFRVRGVKSAWDGEYEIRLPGRHQVQNALFALALGAELGLNQDEIRTGLANCAGAKMRLQLSERNGIRLLNDAYNANADSVAAALETLRDLPCRGRRVAILGDMAELGLFGEAAHAEIGRRAADAGIELLIAVGQQAQVTASEARRAGMREVCAFDTVELAVPAVLQGVKSGDVVLLKASRSSRLERIAEAMGLG